MSHRAYVFVITLLLLAPLAASFVPAAAAAGVVVGQPTFTTYTPPGNLLYVDSAGEPSIGVNWQTNRVMYQSFAATYRATFNDAVSPPSVLWEDVTAPESIFNVDPILHTDSVTGRTWAGGLDGACSVLAMTDDDGDSWLPVGNSCVATLDHESLGSGPYADPAPPTALYERGLYYCAQASIVTCAVSYDGGISFASSTNVPCEFANPGGHGTVHVAPNGRVYIPFQNPGIQTKTCLAYSDDNGLTFSDISIPGTSVPSNGFDADVATTPDSWVYVALSDAQGRARAAVSKDNGATWSVSPDLGEPFGVTVTTFHEAVAGDNERAAIAFLGATTGTPDNAFTSTTYNGQWNLYVAFTYDGGATWETVKVTTDPVQRGCISDAGTTDGTGCRNLLDFMDAQVDRDGRVVVGFADGCRNACAGPMGTPSQSREQYAALARQSGGRGLFAAADSASVELETPITGSAGAPTAITANVVAELPYVATVRWGDGTVESFTGQTSPVFTRSHVYGVAASYPLRIEILGNDGQTASDEATVVVAQGGSGGGEVVITAPAEGETVGDLVRVEGVVEAGAGNAAPVAAFTSSVAGLAAAFDASASSDADGDALTYAWSFGDGATASGVTASHSYATPGLYEVCLSVSDGTASDEACQDVTLQATGGYATIATDPAGDVAPIQTEDFDILKLEARQNAQGEPELVLTLATLAASPANRADRASTTSRWQIEWTNPAGKIDFVALRASALGQTCRWGNRDGGPNADVAAVPCTTIPGTPGKIVMTFPSSALAARGYATGDALTGVNAKSFAEHGIPVGLGSGGTFTTWDTTAPADFVLDDPVSASLAGVPLVGVPRAAPTTPPAQPNIPDGTDDGAFESVPHANVESAWLDADADNLYVGMKIQDIPDTLQQQAFIEYLVSFRPTYEPSDPTWNGNVPATATLRSLQASAMYSPARVRGIDPASDTAPLFLVQFTYEDTGGGFFGELAEVTGTIDPATDIVWMVVPRSVLQNPPGGGVLTDIYAQSSITIGGVFQTGVGDVTGDAPDYAFPQGQLDVPVVTLSASPPAGTSPLQVTFTTTATPADITSWTLTFGDGESASGAGLPPATIQHVYDAPGAFTATLTAVNPDGSASATQGVTVGSGAATRVLVQAAGLDAVEATCADACATWYADLDLGALAEGEVAITATLVQGQTASDVDSVVVTLERGNGADGLVIDEPASGATVQGPDVTIRGRLAGVEDAAPVATLSATPTQGLAPLAVELTLGASDDAGVTSWQLTTGDGEVFGAAGAPPASLSHTYGAGVWTATLTVRDASGQTASDSVAVNAQGANAPPAAPSAPVPASGATNVPVTTLLSWTSSDADGNTLAFDLYLDTADATTLYAANQPGSVLAALQPATTYFWRVVAKDGTESVSGPTWSFTTRAAPLTEAQKPHAIVAVIDTGTSPYSNEFRRANLVESPASWVTGMTPNLKQINLCFFDNATKTVDQSRCPSTVAQAQAADLNEWKRIAVSDVGATGAQQGDLVWFAGTNVLGISFAHAGDANYPILDGAKGADDSHGTYTSSDVAGATTGTCPECLFVMIEVDSVEAIGAGYRWAAAQPWIDVITSSVSVGIIGVGANPVDFFDVNSQAAKTAVTNGKLVFEAAGNGVGNFGLAPTSTALYGNYNPWTIPVGCSVAPSGQSCFYSDFPAPIDATGIDRKAARVDAWSGVVDTGGTSFSAPSSAGVAARAIYALRTQYNDVVEGPSATGTKTLVRLGSSSAPATGPLANGALTRLELEELLFKTARRQTDPTQWDGTLNLDPFGSIIGPSIPPNLALFVKQGYGHVYNGSFGVGATGAVESWSTSGAIVEAALGQRTIPNRWVEEFWWEQVVEASMVELQGSDVPDTDNDAFPRDDPQDPANLGGYEPAAATPARAPLGLSATIPQGAVPTPDNNRLYLHHEDRGVDPASPNGNRIYGRYLNTVAAPSDPLADRSGVGATGIAGAGWSFTYDIAYPQLGGPVLLDTTKDVVVRIAMGALVGDAPATPLSITATLTTEAGALVGTGTGARTLEGTQAVYDVRFRPTVGVITDVTQLTIGWAGPAGSAHIATRGASWIDLPILATLPPADARAIRYFADDVESGWTTNGDTLALTRDASRLQGDADAGSILIVPVANGLRANFLAEDALVTAPAYLGASGTFTAYPCVFSAEGFGAGTMTLKVGVSIGDVPVGGGSLTTTLAGDVSELVPAPIPLTLRPGAIPLGEEVRASLEITTTNGVSTQNVGFCGGGAERPMTLDLSVLDVSGPTTTLEAQSSTWTGPVPVAGNLAAPISPAVRDVVWYAKDLADWSPATTMTMETDGPGSDSGGPIFLPNPDGLVMTLRSARPAIEDVETIGTGSGRVEFWATAVGGMPDVVVDATVLLDGPNGQRVVGTGSLQRHAAPPTALDADPLSPFWNEKFVVSFEPRVAQVLPGEYLLARIVLRDASGASLGTVTCWCGDENRPVIVALPGDESVVPSDLEADLRIGGEHRVVPVVNGRWTTTIDSTTLANGAQTLVVTPQATYAGVVRTGVPIERAVTVQNANLNTPPTATIAIEPASGTAPLAVTATLGGADAQTIGALLSWRIDWGDGTPVQTGTGLPASVAHSYAAGNHVAELRVTDAGGMVATASTPVSVSDPVEPRKVFVALDGGLEVEAVDDSPDGSFSSWHATFTDVSPGEHAAAARYGTSEGTLATANVAFLVAAPVFLNVTSPASGSAVLRTGYVEGNADGVDAPIDYVLGSTDGFTSVVTAASDDGYATWRFPLVAFDLEEDVPTQVGARAVSGERQTTRYVTVTLDERPNARILVATALPVESGVAIQFVSDSTASATGAAIVSQAWDFGDGNTSADAQPAHAFARSGVHTVTLAVTDAAGQAGSTQRTVLVLNRLPILQIEASPALVTTQDVVHLAASAEDADGSVESVALTAYAGSTRDAAVLATGGSALDVRFPDDGSFLVVARATDDEGGIGEAEALVVVQNVRPIAALAAPAMVGEGKGFTLDASGSSDPDGVVEQYRFDPGDGSPVVVQPTPLLTHAYADSGTYLARVTVVDDDGAQITSDAVSIVANAAPILAPVGNQVVAEGATLAFSLAATDEENDAIAFGADGLPEGATLDAQSGAFSWTPDFGQAGNYPVTFRASDGFQDDAEEVILSVGNVDLPPTLDAIGDKSGAEGAPLAFVVRASDPDTPVLTYGATGLPAGASFDTATGAFAWTPGYAQAGAYPVTFWATDGTTTASEDVTITIADTDRLPVIGPIPSMTVTQLLTLSVPVTATDADGAPIQLSLSGAPAGMTLLDNGAGSGRISWTPGLDAVGVYAFQVVATSGPGIATKPASVTVVFNTAFAMTTPSAVLAASPGQVVDIVATVRNTGPNADTFRFQLADSMGWTLATTPAPVTLAPGAQTTVVAQVTAPAGGPSDMVTLKGVSMGNAAVTRTLLVRIDLPVTLELVVDRDLVADPATGKLVVRYLDGSVAPGVSVSIRQTWRFVSGVAQNTLRGTSDATGTFAFDFSGEAQALVPGAHDLIATARNGAGPEAVARDEYVIGRAPTTPSLEAAGASAWAATCGQGPRALQDSEGCRNLRGDYGLTAFRLCAAPSATNMPATTLYQAFQDVDPGACATKPHEALLAALALMDLALP